MFNRPPFTAIARNRDGAVGAVTALVLPLLMIILALAVDLPYGYASRSQLQTTADAAALAGALALPQGTPAVHSNAAAMAAINMPSTLYGTVLPDSDIQLVHWDAATRRLTNGPINAVHVSAHRSASNGNALPALFWQVAGRTSQDVNVESLALSSARQYCLLALAGAGVSILSNGAPKANLPCNIMANGNMVCHGHDLGAPIGDAAGNNSGCGVVQHSNVAPVTDPYTSLAANIPPNTCSSYPQEPTGKKGTALPSSNQLSGSKSYSAPQTFCGDVQLIGNVTLSGPNNVLVIRNGQLDTNGNKITTARGASATIIFTGDNGSYNHTPTGGGMINISSPNSGTWSGVAIYTDPKLTSGVDISYSGNSPSWNISGLAYFPQSSITFSGAVGKATTGQSCFVLVMKNLRINGTGSMLNDISECTLQGLNTPSGPPKSRLVS